MLPLQDLIDFMRILYANVCTPCQEAFAGLDSEFREAITLIHNFPAPGLEIKVVLLKTNELGPSEGEHWLDSQAAPTSPVLTESGKASDRYQSPFTRPRRFPSLAPHRGFTPWEAHSSISALQFRALYSSRCYKFFRYNINCMHSSIRYYNAFAAKNPGKVTCIFTSLYFSLTGSVTSGFIILH